MERSTAASQINPIRVQWLSERAVRITHAGAGGASFPPDRPWLAEVLQKTNQTPGEPHLQVVFQDGKVVIRRQDGEEVITYERPLEHKARGAFRLFLKLAADEALYGFGEWFNAFRREKGRVRLRTQEAVPPLQRWRSYSTIPFFISSRGYGLLLLNSHRSEFRIRRKRDLLEIQAAGPPADYLVIEGPDFKEIIKTYTELTGRPPLPPRWAFGLWATGFPQESQERVIKRVQEHRRRHIPLDAVILDYHWQQGFHSLRWRRSLFPDPPAFIASLKQEHVRLGLIFAPFLNRKNYRLLRILLHALVRNLPPGTWRDDERVLEDYRLAQEKKYLAHDRVRWWFGSGGMLDFTNPQAASWWGSKLQELLRSGAAFFKNDDGEYLPASAQSHIGIDGAEHHNLYGLYYGKAVFEATAAIDDRRPLILARSVFVGSQRFPALFLGDQQPTFKHMQGTMRAGLNLSLLGFAYWGPDVFGLLGKVSPELHQRYAQWALFAPIARYFWRPPEIDDTRFPWSHGQPAEDSFRNHAKLRLRLLPYWLGLAWEAHLSGMPLIRPLLLAYPKDPRFGDVFDQVLLGDCLLLAPVLQAGARTREILLPEGLWHDFWSTESYPGGGRVSVPAPLDRLPILVKGGSILPMGPALECIPDDHRLHQLELHCWPPYNGQMVLYDDDGVSRAYQRGEFSKTQIQMKSDSTKVTLKVEAAKGSFPNQVQNRNITFLLERSKNASQVLVNQKPATWNYLPESSSVWVKVLCPTDKGTLIEILF